uniref:Uncharacterized protein n=1 Tax=Setaria viridis TaxID=4556 RepID=A0A4U6SV34_SETVI|nr:hypothetical protein SEVIR_9G126500v2 [Setaria viridis]
MWVPLNTCSHPSLIFNPSYQTKNWDESIPLNQTSDEMIPSQKNRNGTVLSLLIFLSPNQTHAKAPFGTALTREKRALAPMEKQLFLALSYFVRKHLEKWLLLAF